jgi:hypothetical protein
MTAASACGQSAPAPGPCEQAGAIGSIVDRPGLGRPTATNGSPCAVPTGDAMLELGYRSQSTQGSAGTSALAIYPLAVIRVGVAKRTELVFAPPAFSTRSGAALGGVFVPASGSQDLGFGIKRTFDDRPAFQDAFEFFYTAPTGAPQGISGFSAGGPAYTLSYTAAIPLGSTVGVSLTQNAIANAVPQNPAGATRFFAYQPSLTLSYGFAPNTSLLLSDQITTPLGPAGGTGNRALVALQRVLSSHIVIDAEYEVNILPAAPASSQHAFGGGAALLF